MAAKVQARSSHREGSDLSQPPELSHRHQKGDASLAPICRLIESTSRRTQSSVIRRRSVVKNAAPLDAISRLLAGKIHHGG
jgi:hypothetical protein